MTDYAIPIVWPDYRIVTPSGPAIGGLGHAGVVIVNGSTGATNYFEYGRYDRDADGNPIGAVQTRSVPNVVMVNGSIDGASLQNLVVNLNASAGHGSAAMGTVLPLSSGGYSAALAYAQQAQSDPNGTLGNYSWVNDNHCYSFAKAVAAAGGSWVDWFDGFGPFDNVPSSAIIELIANRGGFIIGGPQGNIFLGGVTRYVDEVDFANCFFAQTPVLLSDGTTAPIESVRSGDMVMAYDADGALVPARVTRVLRHDVRHILDVFGLMVTPGHVTLCGDGRFAGRHVPILDILRSDGALVRADGTMVRAATGADLGSVDDDLVWVVTGAAGPDGFAVRSARQLRRGTRILTEAGHDITLAEVIAANGGRIGADGLVCMADAAPGPFVWPFGPDLPNPEDYVLARSAVTLAEIYAAAEWDGMDPLLDAPTNAAYGPGDGGANLPLRLAAERAGEGRAERAPVRHVAAPGAVAAGRALLSRH